GNSKTETPTPEPAVKKESVTVKPTTDDVLAFLSYYTRTLLYGTYTDHAALFDSQCDWEGTTYSSASMYSIASNFYGGYSTLEHSFNLLDASFDSGGNATVTVTEYQRTRNKYSGAYASASVKKRMLLNYYSGTFRISYVRTIATY
ncbi:MAG: hypothetical protein HUU43_15925, partial [Ignavibacteriaceae bacterium]|nr:hypothetical protein [Ignavibacteriaceae bacterium]